MYLMDKRGLIDSDSEEETDLAQIDDYPKRKKGESKKHFAKRVKQFERERYQTEEDREFIVDELPEGARFLDPFIDELEKSNITEKQRAEALGTYLENIKILRHKNPKAALRLDPIPGGRRLTKKKQEPIQTEEEGLWIQAISDVERKIRRRNRHKEADQQTGEQKGQL